MSLFSNYPSFALHRIEFVDKYSTRCVSAALRETKENFPQSRRDAKKKLRKYMENELVKEELIRLGSEWAEAMVANDAEQIGSFMSDDWVIVSERGVSTKEDFLGFVASGALTHSKFEMASDARVKVYGDTAVMTIRVVNTAHFGGQQFDADEWATDVFVKQNGKWLCVHSHITAVDKEFEKMMKEKQQ
jgi:ketosteroid isomerase-like protein